MVISEREKTFQEEVKEVLKLDFEKRRNALIERLLAIKNHESVEIREIYEDGLNYFEKCDGDFPWTRPRKKNPEAQKIARKYYGEGKRPGFRGGSGDERVTVFENVFWNLITLRSISIKN